MSAPRPVIYCPTLESYKAAIRALYDMGYEVCPGRTFAQQASVLDKYWSSFQVYPYVCADNYYIAWSSVMPDYMTMVNSVSHLKSYMARHGMVLTAARPVVNQAV